MHQGRTRPVVGISEGWGRAFRASPAPPLIAVAVGQAILQHGGFSTAARILFAALSAAAACAALATGGRPALAAARHPFVVVLLALAAAGALSSLWTVSFSEDALTWALLPLGYGLLALAVIAAADAAAVRVAVLAALCVCAFVSGLVGLLAAASFSEPQAVRPTGAWRPAGTLEYTPALVVLQVSALPALLRALCAGGRIALLAAAPAVVAGAVLGLSHSRLGVALAAAVLVAALLAPRVTARATRREAMAAVALVLLAGVAARAVLGGAVPFEAEVQRWRVAVVVAACLCAPLAWAAASGLGLRRWSPIVLALAVAAVFAGSTVGGFAGSLAPTSAAPRAVEDRAATQPQRSRALNDDVLHGRRAIWTAGLEAFRERPLQGHGAASFLTATVDRQRRPLTTYAHSLPLELAVELGLLGVLLAIGLFFVPMRALWKARASSDAWLFGVPALAFLVAGLVDWQWHIAGAGAVWAASTGALARSRVRVTVAAGAGHPARPAEGDS